MSKPAEPPAVNVHRYQAVLLGPGAAGDAALTQILIERSEALGLKPGELRVLTAATFAQYDPKAPLAAVYLAGLGTTEDDDSITARLARDGVSVLPLVPTLEDYKKQVPACLHAVNTRPYSLTEGSLAQVASWVMENLGLQRQHRQIFLSYRRKESASVAQQLYHALDERSFHVFLDTHSIPSGRLFDPWIHNWMAEAEVLLLLGTQTVFDSSWVELEFTRAQELGVGVLYLVWPNAQVPPVAALAEKYYLENSDFEGGLTSPGAKLSENTVVEIIGKAETLRARSLAARQARIVGALCRKIEGRGLTFLRTWQSYVEVIMAEGGGRRVYPIVGRPDSNLMEKVHRECESDAHAACLLFDARGVREEIKQHLDWLNRFSPVQVFSLQQADEWIVKR